VHKNLNAALDSRMKRRSVDCTTLRALALRWNRLTLG